MHFLRLASLFVTTSVLTLSLMARAEATVATVNGVAIPQAKMDIVLKTQSQPNQPDTPERRAQIRDTLINQEIIVQEAQKKGLDKKADFMLQVELQKQEALVNVFVQDFLKSKPITDDLVQKEFERIKLAMPDKEFKASHILVDKEDDAKQIIAQIKKGAKFEKLAAEKSKDPGSKIKGGSLDWAPAATYVKPFGEALTSMKKGQLSEVPVKSNFGWHVIRIDDMRTTKVPTLAEAKPQIIQMLERQEIQKMLTELRAKAKVE